MRCIDCEFSQETLPAQRHYVYCKKQMIEVQACKELERCIHRDKDLMIRLGYKYLGNGTWIKEVTK